MKLLDILKEAITAKISPSNFKLIQKGKDKEIYLLNDENYTTLSGLEFNLKTLGIKNPKQNYFFYIKTDVYYKGNLLIGNDGIPGLKKYESWDVVGSINKAKKWLDTNGDKLISGKKYQYKST
jgi:hypothetical protein